MTRFYDFFLNHVLEAGGKKRKISVKQQMYNELTKIPKIDHAFYDLSYTNPNKILGEFDIKIPQSQLKVFKNYLNKIQYGIEIEGCFENIDDFNLFDNTGDPSIKCSGFQKAREYVTKILKYSNFEKDFPQIEKVIDNNNGCKQETCGGHVHMSLPPSLIRKIYHIIIGGFF